jgi:hypothetical protein
MAPLNMPKKEYPEAEEHKPQVLAPMANPEWIIPSASSMHTQCLYFSLKSDPIIY